MLSATSKYLVAATILVGCGGEDPIVDDEEDTAIPGSVFSTLQAKFALARRNLQSTNS